MASAVPGMAAEERERNTKRGGDWDRPHGDGDGEPIVLTAISTVLGMLPIAVTIFWGPMAVAIRGGLLVATRLTLVFLPALYVVWFHIKEPLGGRATDIRTFNHYGACMA